MDIEARLASVIACNSIREDGYTEIPFNAQDPTESP